MCDLLYHWLPIIFGAAGVFIEGDAEVVEVPAAAGDWPKTSSLGILSFRRYWPCTVLICFQRSDNTFPQSLHALLVPLWTASMWGSRLDLVVKIFPQCGHGSDSSFNGENWVYTNKNSNDIFQFYKLYLDSIQIHKNLKQKYLLKFLFSYRVGQ